MVNSKGIDAETALLDYAESLRTMGYDKKFIVSQIREVAQHVVVNVMGFR